MSEELSNATRIAALDEQVRQLTEKLQSEYDHSAKLESALVRANKYGQQADADLATERERCGVLEREVLAAREWINVHMSNYSHGQRSKNDHDAAEWLEEAAKATDTRHALDAAKFGKEPA